MEIMKIFITGGSGFIGRNLTEQLESKYTIFAPNSLELNLLDEVAVLDYLQQNKFDVVIHAATWNATKTSTKDTNLVLDHNLRMFFNLARGSGFYKKMLYFGSGAEFDRNHWIPKMNEDYFDSFVPTDQYGFSKYLMKKYTEKAENIINLRLFGVFGKYEDWQIRFISQTCCRAIHDLPIIINQNVNFDYTYIDDIVEITEWFIHNEPNAKSYNICTSNTYTLVELAKMVLDISGKQLEIRITKEGMGREYSGTNTKLINEMNGFNFRNTEECISELYKWYQNQTGIQVNKL
jgi:GDP-L-fucose synthase